MKYIQNLAMISAVIGFAGCNANKTEPKDQEPQTEKSLSESDTLKSSVNPTAEMKTVEGTVNEIVTGKDGYTAKIQTEDNTVYFVTVSHSNLTNAKQYRAFNASEIVKVSGDYFKVGTENHITVREIL